MESKKFEWNETYWDNMTREQLLVETKRLYSAMSSLYYVVLANQSLSPNAPYWGTSGVGGIALEKANQINRAINTYFEGDEEPMHVFRYLDGFLFDNSEYEIGHNWYKCSNCPAMFANINRMPYNKNEICKMCDIGTMSPLKWTDIFPDTNHDGDYRNMLGRKVREIWVRYCKRTGNYKPSHIAPYDELSEWDKGADITIAEELLQELGLDNRLESMVDLKFSLDGESYGTTNCVHTVRDLLALAGINDEHHYIVKWKNGIEKEFRSLDDIIRIEDKGVYLTIYTGPTPN